jgi:NAD(P)-dependent dehydrogenase (short-subunit alcohol dehydrogenase family)
MRAARALRPHRAGLDAAWQMVRKHWERITNIASVAGMRANEN